MLLLDAPVNGNVMVAMVMMMKVSLIVLPIAMSVVSDAAVDRVHIHK